MTQITESQITVKTVVLPPGAMLPLSPTTEIFRQYITSSDVGDYKEEDCYYEDVKIDNLSSLMRKIGISRKRIMKFEETPNKRWKGESEVFQREKDDEDVTEPPSKRKKMS